MDTLPQRPIAHATGDAAVHLFRNACPQEWIAHPVAADYGLDIRYEVVRGGRVTGEEFYAQVKGHRSVASRKDDCVAVQVANSTVNYWLGKLNPVMVVVVDTSQKHLWFGWLEHIYNDWPKRLNVDGVATFLLKTHCGDAFANDVANYVSGWFTRIHGEIQALSSHRTELARFAFHTASIARCLTQLHLTLTSGRSADEVRDGLQTLFLEYGIHDSFLQSLWEPDSPWYHPLSSHLAGVILPKLESYIAERRHFWMREQRVTTGDIDFIPFSYSALRTHLIPTLEAAWDLQDTLNQLIVLGNCDVRSHDNDALPA